MTEIDLMNQIRVALSEKGFCVFRTNVGKFKLPDGRWFDTGLPKGHSDLYAVKDGRIYYIEVKKEGGKISDEQINFLKQMKERYGCSGDIAHSVEDAFRICGVI